MADRGTVTITQYLIRVIQNHYTTSSLPKSEKVLEQESWLVPGVVKFNRWYTMPAAFVVQFCCGSLYSWSVFNQPIDISIYRSIVNMAPITFYIAVGLLGLSAAIMGPWLERKGPKLACILGGSLFCVGHLLCALALYLRYMWLVYLGFGVCAGYGIGLCYISPVSALQKWFPDRRGLASGIAVSGFGAGSIFSAKLELLLIHHVDLPLTFIIIGVVYFFCIFICGLVLRTPPPGFNPKPNNTAKSSEANNDDDDDVETQTSVCDSPAVTSPATPDGVEAREKDKESGWTLLEALVCKDYRLMYVMFFSNILFGLVAISRLSNMITDIFGKTSEHAATIVSINGGFNLSGRIFFPLLSDYIGRKNAYVVMLSCQLLILSSFYFITTTKTYWLFLLCMFIIAATYGGGFGTIPAFLTDKFGPSNIGALHGVALTAWALAGICGGIVFTTVFKLVNDGRMINDPFPYNVNVFWMLLVVVSGWSALMFVKPTKKDSQIYNQLLCRSKK